MSKSNQRTVPRLLLVLIVAVGLPLGALACYWLMTFPDVGRLAHRNPSTTALMETRRAQDRGGTVHWSWVPLTKISPHLQRAVIVAEDASFYRHEGFDWEGLKDAAVKNLEQGRWGHGGSTITQQLAKNLYLTTEKSLWRKAREALITRELEHRLTKKRILELYLNVAEWGRGVYGAEAAARHHFRKSAVDLTREEAALLAAILPSPRHYDPLRKTRYVLVRQQQILRWMDTRSAVARRST
ncbi:monofunctional biosynthetic peptidoglycan transglycosylase [Candidatus Nitrospira bockiana]